MTDEKLMEIAKQVKESHLSFGVRSLDDDEDYKVGDRVRDSYEWDFEADCSAYDLDENAESAGYTCTTGFAEFLDGTDSLEDWAAAIKDTIEYNSQYGGTQVLVLGREADDTIAINNDDREVDLANPTVIAIVEN